MVEDSIQTAAQEPGDPGGRVDALIYINALSAELAGMAERHGYSRLAATLEQARDLSREALAELAQGGGKAAPEDAA